MSDMGLGTDDWTRQALAQALAARQQQSPAMPPQGIPGTLPGVVDANVGGQGQSAPAGIPGVPRPRISVEKAGSWPQVQTQGILNSTFPMNAIPGPGDLVPNRTQTAANIPSPQAQPQQMPAIPPASPVGRTQAAQGQGNPLDHYFQQMMALQRQRMLLGMAGGLLGAPSFGQGLGRAFTNASESIAPQSDMVSRIAGAQAAGQLERQRPGSNEADVRAKTMQALFDPASAFKVPEFQTYKAGGIDRRARMTASGRLLDDGTGVPAWAHTMGFRKADGGLTYDPAEAARSVDPKDGRVKYMMSDWKPRSIDADSAAEGER